MSHDNKPLVGISCYMSRKQMLLEHLKSGNNPVRLKTLFFFCVHATVKF